MSWRFDRTGAILTQNKLEKKRKGFRSLFNQKSKCFPFSVIPQGLRFKGIDYLYLTVESFVYNVVVNSVGMAPCVLAGVGRSLSLWGSLDAITPLTIQRAPFPDEEGSTPSL